MKAILKNTRDVLDKKEKKQFSLLILPGIVISILDILSLALLLARALYKEADLIIPDEPFSELDEEAECLLLQNFRKLSQAGKTIILITHNTKSLAGCNKLVAL